MKPQRILTTLLLALGISTAANATFPVRRTLTHQQPDGTTLTINAVGNGRYTIYTTADGQAILPAANGHYYYATLQNGTLAPSTRLASNLLTAPSKTQSQQRVPLLTAAQAVEVLEAQNPPTPLLRLQVSRPTPQSLTTSTADGLGKYGTSANGAVQSIGSVTLPVVMVNFSDVAFQDTITIEKVNRFFNEEGYRDEPAARGCVRDYFVAQSNGLFQPHFKVVAHVTLPNTRAYYGKDSESGSTDPNCNAFVKDALAEASKTVDFSPFCLQGTNDVPMVALMFAGPGQQSSFEDGHSDYLWAKFSQTTFKVNNDQVRIGSYFIGNELLQQYGQNENDIIATHLDGIGLFAHEFSHALGLPDFYNTASSDGSQTMGYWDLLDYGQYYQNGYRPVEYTAYERSYLGWLNVTELTDQPCVARLGALDGSHGDELPRAYVLRNPENSSEYYLLENRTQNTWHTSRMGNGMLITHVDYNASAWSSNRVNVDKSHQRMQFVPADNIKEGTRTTAQMSFNQLFEGIRNDLYPCTTKVSVDGNVSDKVNNSFTDDSEPAATLYTGGKLSRPIYNITRQNDGTVTFSYLDANLTNLHSVHSTLSTTQAPVYDLQGRRYGSLSQAPSGIYIVAGKKVIK